MKIWLHLFQLSFKDLIANISKELVIWKINVFISILVSIVENVIMNQKMLQEKQSYKITDSLWVDQSLEMDINNQEITSILPKSTISSKDSSYST